MQRKQKKVRHTWFLLVMGWRNPLEEDFSSKRIHIGVNPSGPSGQTFLKCNQSIHVLVIFATFLYVIPSATKTRRRHPVLSFSYNNIIKLKKNVLRLFIHSYGWDRPVWVHQCHVLKINMSMPLHALPATIESSLMTRPIFSLTRSTR